MSSCSACVAAIGFAGQGDAAQGEVDAGGQAHRGDDDAQLAGLGQRFDDAGARAVAQAAVMIGDAALEQLGEVLADDELLLGAELEGIGRGQLAGEFGGHGFGGLAARGEDQDRPEVFGQRLGDEARPVAADFGRDVVAQAVGMDFLERHGAMRRGGSRTALRPSRCSHLTTSCGLATLPLSSSSCVCGGARAMASS